MENEKLLVVGCKAYNFSDRNTGETLKGLNVHYLSESKDDNVVGFSYGKANLNYDLFNDYKNAPFPFYAKPVTKIEFSGNRPSIKIIDFEPLENVEIVKKKAIKS